MPRPGTVHEPSTEPTGAASPPAISQGAASQRSQRSDGEAVRDVEEALSEYLAVLERINEAGPREGEIPASEL